MIEAESVNVDIVFKVKSDEDRLDVYRLANDYLLDVSWLESENEPTVRVFGKPIHTGHNDSIWVEIIAMLRAKHPAG